MTRAEDVTYVCDCCQLEQGYVLESGLCVECSAELEPTS